MLKPHSDDAALAQTQQATAILKTALSNFYLGDPAHEILEDALRSTQRAEEYLKRLRDNL